MEICTTMDEEVQFRRVNFAKIAKTIKSFYSSCVVNFETAIIKIIFAHDSY